MRKGLLAFRRRHLWCLLVGAMGGVMGGTSASAADAQPAAGSGGNATDAAPGLRQSLQLGERRTPVRRSKAAAREAQLAASAAVSLRLSSSLALRPGSVIAAAPSGTGAAVLIAASGGRGTTGAGNSTRSDPGADDGPGQPDAPVPFDATPSGALARRPQPAPVRAAPELESLAAGLPDLSGETWQMAPVHWQGNTGTGGSLFVDAGSRSFGLNNQLNVAVNSFIVAPYIATWSGSFGMNSSSNRFSSESGPTSKGDSSGNNFGGSLSVFPVSNFPFSASFSRSSSESRSGENRGEPSISTGFRLGQEYRTEDGRDRYSASYDRNAITSGNSVGVSSSMQGSFSTRRVVAPEQLLEGEHSINVSAGYSPASNDISGQAARRLNASVSHGWTVHEDLSINNLLTMANSRVSQYQGDTLAFNESTLLLGSSTFNWRPDEDLPLTVSGGGNLSHVQTKTGLDAAPTSQQSVSANLSAGYRYSDNLSFGGGGSVGISISGANRFSVASASGSASYAGNPMRFAGYAYGWSLGGGVNGSVISASGSASGASTSSFGGNASASHNLARDIIIDERQNFNLSAGQSVSLSMVQGSSAFFLSNSVGAGWRASYGEALSANLSAGGSYSIGTGNTQSLAANLIGGGSYQISSRQSLTLNSNVNWIQTRSPAIQTQELNQSIVDGSQSSLSGYLGLGYAHTSPFSIRNLSYTANLLWVGSQSSQRLVSADPRAGRLQTSVSLQQVALYRIGRLSFNLSAAVINSGGRTSTSVFGSVNREFGGFFDGRW